MKWVSWLFPPILSACSGSTPEASIVETDAKAVTSCVLAQVAGGTFTEGDVVPAPLEVQNTGTKSRSCYVDGWLLDATGTTIDHTGAKLRVGGGETTTHTFELGALPAGSYTVLACATDFRGWTWYEYDASQCEEAAVEVAVVVDPDDDGTTPPDDDTDSPGDGSTIVAASASRDDVAAAVDEATDGDTVLIPDGSATWTEGIRTTKQIIIRAQHYTPTAQPTTSTQRNVVITYDGTTQHALDMTSGDDFHVGVGGITFLPPVPDDQGGQEHGIWGYVHFSGSGTKPPLLFDSHFVGNNRDNVTAGEAAFLSIDSLGAVVWNTLFDGTQVPDGTSVAVKGMGGAGIHISSPRSWETASTMGTLDTDGQVNVVFEDSRWIIWGQSDVDDDGRLVLRHSTVDGTSWQTHGFTSATGGRAMEAYDCDFLNTVEERNHKRYFWLRAGTVLLTDNYVSDEYQGYGNPILLDVGDRTTPEGAYPVDRGPGRGHDGSDHVSDPIYLWDNSGGAGSAWGVGDEWADHVELGRDIFVDSGAKPGWTKYPYPHPFRSVIEGE